MHFLSPDLEQYLEDNSQEEPQLLKELARQTHLKVLQPRMITGHYQGRVLSLISKMIRPKTILEIGTYTGYSALCLAEGMTAEGVMHTIDINEELNDFQKQFFNQSVYAKQIITHIGDALEIIPNLDLTFDLVFIDAEKKQYASYFEAVINKCHSGSVILSDNVLWSGKVVEPIDDKDEATQAVIAYNQKIKNDPRVETVILSIRDGLTLSRVR